MGVVIVGLSSKALGAAALNQIVSLSAHAILSSEIVDLVGPTLDSADQRINIVVLASGTLGAVVVNQIVSWFADASPSHPILIDCANGGADSIAALSAYFLVSINTVATLQLLIVDLG